MEVRRPQRAVPPHGAPSGIHLRRTLPPGGDLQGTLPRHRLVLDHRRRVGRPGAGVPGVAGSRQFRRGTPAPTVGRVPAGRAADLTPRPCTTAPGRDAVPFAGRYAGSGTPRPAPGRPTSAGRPVPSPWPPPSRATGPGRTGARERPPADGAPTPTCPNTPAPEPDSGRTR